MFVCEDAVSITYYYFLDKIFKMVIKVTPVAILPTKIAVLTGSDCLIS